MTETSRQQRKRNRQGSGGNGTGKVAVSTFAKRTAAIKKSRCTQRVCIRCTQRV
ncbi:MAG: hypothetical protein LBU81_01220 [Methanosarcinales archaeon]|nr:hypothetical protein [Methanosarcinales archaeon]